MIVVTEITRTCSACPAQWEGRLDDGRFIYIRFRWGCLGVEVGSTPDKAIDGETVFEWTDTSGWNGFMKYDELKKLTTGVLQLPETETI